MVNFLTMTNPIDALQSYLKPSEVMSFSDCVEYQNVWSCKLSVRGMGIHVSGQSTKMLAKEHAAEQMLEYLLCQDELSRINESRPNVMDKRAMMKWHLNEFQHLLDNAKFE